MNSNCKFVLMRHGLAEHNQAKQQLKKTHSTEHIKKLPLYQGLQFSDKFIDSSLVTQGQQESYNCSKTLQNSNIGLILVSPLRRCLQTSKIIVSNWKTPTKVIVQPLLADRRSSSWSLNWKLKQSKQLFREFDWSQCQNSLYAQNEQTLKQRYIYCKQSSSKSNEQGQFGVMINMKEVVEPYQHFKNRIKKLVEKLKKYKSITSQKILIVSHSSLFKFLLAEQYLPNGKPKGKLKFEHCTPVFCHQQMIIKSPKL